MMFKFQLERNIYDLHRSTCVAASIPRTTTAALGFLDFSDLVFPIAINCLFSYLLVRALPVKGESYRPGLGLEPIRAINRGAVVLFTKGAVVPYFWLQG